MAIPYSSTYKPSPLLDSLMSWQNPGAQSLNQTQGAFATPLTDQMNINNAMSPAEQYGAYGAGGGGITGGFDLAAPGSFTGAGGDAGKGGIFGNLFDGDFMKGLLGSKDKDGMGSNGWGGLALGAANTFMNMKNYGLAEQQFNQNKALTTANFNNQLALTRDRQDNIFQRDSANAALNKKAAPTAPRQLTGLA